MNMLNYVKSWVPQSHWYLRCKGGWHNFEIQGAPVVSGSQQQFREGSWDPRLSYVVIIFECFFKKDFPSHSVQFDSLFYHFIYYNHIDHLCLSFLIIILYNISFIILFFIYPRTSQQPQSCIKYTSQETWAKQVQHNESLWWSKTSLSIYTRM